MSLWQPLQALTRPEYHPSYYGAFVTDPDGYNVEAVCHANLDRNQAPQRPSDSG